MILINLSRFEDFGVKQLVSLDKLAWPVYMGQ